MPALKTDGKMELIKISSELMPSGKPNFLSVVKYPMIKDLIIQRGEVEIYTVLFLLVKDFCASMNVVRNMNEDQMIEAAGMLLDECGNFRLEDYVMMFQMAKRGELFDIHDRIDLQVITRMLDAYWDKRHTAGEEIVATEICHFDTIGNPTRTNEKNTVWDDEKGYIQVETVPQKFGALLSQFDAMKTLIEDKVGTREERNRLKQVEKEDTEKIRQQLKERGYE